MWDDITCTPSTDIRRWCLCFIFCLAKAKYNFVNQDQVRWGLSKDVFTMSTRNCAGVRSLCLYAICYPLWIINLKLSLFWWYKHSLQPNKPALYVFTQILSDQIGLIKNEFLLSRINWPRRGKVRSNESEEHIRKHVQCCHSNTFRVALIQSRQWYFQLFSPEHVVRKRQLALNI